MYRLLLIFILLILFLTPVPLYPDSQKVSSHGDKSKLPKGCASCHKGHGVFNTPMLPETEDIFCFRCHGHNTDVDETKKGGYLSKDVILTDIKKEFEKPYHHPIEKIGIHKYNEQLPENDPSMPRHSVCADCHHHHYVTKKNITAGIKGVDSRGSRVDIITSEYELCFKCHSYSANLPPDQTNKAEIFNPSNPSYHPVIARGKNEDVPSLILPLTAASTIKCTDCHGNDNDMGPKGPHGSEYRHILKRNYTTNDGPEGDLQYKLCYHCHSRDSILSNRSFLYHSRHISGVGTSCRTCHNPHGSLRYTHLIDFDNTSVTPTSDGRLEYVDFGHKAGQCFLTCHGVEHGTALKPSIYPSSISGSGSSVPKIH